MVFDLRLYEPPAYAGVNRSLSQSIGNCKVKNHLPAPTQVSPRVRGG